MCILILLTEYQKIKMVVMEPNNYGNGFFSKLLRSVVKNSIDFPPYIQFMLLVN